MFERWTCQRQFSQGLVVTIPFGRVRCDMQILRREPESAFSWKGRAWNVFAAVHES